MIPVSALLFDFDGVIMDSMHIKLESYLYALSEFRLQQSDVSRIQRKLAGFSRYRVISSIVKELKGNLLNEKELKYFGERFEEYDKNQIHRMQIVEGSKEYLNSIYKNYFTSVVTGTPQSSIELVMQTHKLTRYFDSINGSPESKPRIIDRLIAEYGFRKEEVVLIGDGRVDQEAAESTGIRFIGFNRPDSSFRSNECWKVVSNLLELQSELKPVPNKAQLS